MHIYKNYTNIPKSAKKYFIHYIFASSANTISDRNFILLDIGYRHLPPKNPSGSSLFLNEQSGLKTSSDRGAMQCAVVVESSQAGVEMLLLAAYLLPLSWWRNVLPGEHVLSVCPVSRQGRPTHPRSPTPIFILSVSTLEYEDRKD